MMALCAGLLVACDKEEEYEPVKPPVEQPEEPNEPDKPVTPPSTDDIINVKIGDLNMIVGIDDWNDIAYGNGKYVAVSVYCKTATSTDGNNWTSQTMGKYQKWEYIAENSKARLFVGILAQLFMVLWEFIKKKNST